MITITIDGREIRTDPSKTIIEAAFENGVYVPHFCWHPALSVSGNCRMCLVEVEKMPKQVIACSTQCADGMAVHVNSPRAVEARQAVMEFILINHPLDCPICDEAGECKLQEYAYRFGAGESRFDEEKARKPKRVALGPHVMFDAERCISCSRCIRFCEEKAHAPELTFVDRGDRVTIEPFPGRALENPYALNVVDICPVGALTSRAFRFRSRVWDLSETPTVCPGCARGCSAALWVRQNEIYRMTPRENQEVNDFWMCDRGRLESWTHVHDPARIASPLVRRDGALVPCSWADALDAVVRGLAGIPAEAIGVVGSASDTCEDQYVLARFAREILHAAFLDAVPHTVPDDEDDFLIRADKTANARGARLVGLAADSGAPGLDALLEALSRGAIRAVLVADRDAHAHPGWTEAIASAGFVTAIVSTRTPVAERADVVLPASTFAEKLGTFVNFAGQMQLVRPALVTAGNTRWSGGLRMSRLDAFASPFDRWGTIEPADCRPTWSVVADLARALGADWSYAHPEDVFDDIVRTVPLPAGTTYATLGARGIRLGDAVPEPLLPYVYTDVH